MLRLGAQLCVRTALNNFVKRPVVDVLKKENLTLLNAQFVREIGFLNKCTKQDLWKGILTVSNAGKKKGRGKRKSRVIRVNVNASKSEKEGTPRFQWPGFNTLVLKGDRVANIKEGKSGEKQQPVAPAPQTRSRRSLKVTPLERGWSGKSVVGRKMGPPQPLHDKTFEGFESIILEHKLSLVMSSIFGKRKKYLSIVATGNGNGLIGLAKVERFNSGKITLNLAQKQASKRLISINLIEKHTVNHDFFSEHGNTKLFVFKKPKEYGLKCHRVIQALCQLIGIENLYAKVEGPCNVERIIKAFIVGLLRQKTYQQIADEKNLHLIELKKESHYFPQVLASPKECLTLAEVRRKPVVFEEYIMGDKLVYRPGKKIPFYEKLPSWRTHLLRTEFCRNHEKVKIELLVKYDKYMSHLTEIYPECTDPLHRNKNKKNAEE